MIATHKDDEPEKRPLPEGWVWKTVDEISESIRYGYTESANEKPVGPRFLRITDIQDGRVDWDTVPYCPCSAEDHQKYKLLPGDIVFARTGATTGKSFLIKQCPDTVFASYLIRLRLKSVANTKFFSYFLQTPDYWSQITFVKKGSAQPGVNATLLATLKLPLPPLPEQERIVARLEELLSDLEAGVAALGRVRAGVKRYKASVLKAACEGKLFGDKGIENGEFPEGWRWVTLDDVCGKIQDGTHFSPKVQYDEPGVGRYLYITAKNIKEHGIILKEITYIDEDAHRENTKRCDPQIGDVLLIKYGVTTGVATVNQLEEEFTLLSSVALLRPKLDLLDPYFLKHYLNCPVGFKMITGEMTGTAIKRIILAKIKISHIPLPPLEEQRRIVAEVERRLESARAVESAVEVGLKRARRLRQAVLRSAFEGRLVS